MNKVKMQRKLNNKLLKQWKIDVKNKYNNKCALCQSTIRLNAHHILSYQLYKKHRYAIENGICLCAGCHKFRKGSPHKDPIIFADWLMINHSITYNWIITNAKST